MENKPITNKKLLDYIIGVQLYKVEKYNSDLEYAKDADVEGAMINLIELLKLRKKL